MPTRDISRTTAGVLLMALAMLTIPLVDGIAKYLSATHSPLFISWTRYVVATLLVLPIAIRSHGRQFLPLSQLGTHLLRTVLLVVGMICYFVAIASVPLAAAASAYFVGPIIAMGLAVVLLREVLTRRKVLSLALGFVGTLIVLRPTAGVDVGLLLAFASGVCFAIYMIATRHASQQAHPLQTLAFQCLIGTVLLTPQGVWTWSVPALGELWIFLLLGVFSVLSHILSITALRYAEASTLAPLIYLELPGAALIGYFAFGEVPSVHVWLGAAAILAGGVLLLPRRSRDRHERSRRR